MKELGLSQAEVARRVSDLAQQLNLATLDVKTLSASLNRKSDKSQWSDLIAEALNVNHRWLQCGAGPKERLGWPFPRVSEEKINRLTREDRVAVESAIVVAADHFGLGILNVAA